MSYKVDLSDLERSGEVSLTQQLVDRFAATLRNHGLPVETGRFAAHMQVSLINDGPFTIWLDSDAISH